MVKKVVSLIVGFGLITAGAAGITIVLADRDKKAALEELEMARAANRAIVAEEQKKVDEKRQEVESLAKSVEADKQKMETEKQRMEARQHQQEEHLKYKAAVLEEQRKAAMEKQVAAAEQNAAAVKEKSSGKGVVLTEKTKPLKKSKSTASAGHSQKTVTASASGLNPKAEAVNNMGRKAGMEAAKLYEPVEYYNKATRELLRAEPYDRGNGWVRVRIRIWRDDRLVKDTVVAYSRSLLNEPRRSRV